MYDDRQETAPFIMFCQTELNIYLSFLAQNSHVSNSGAVSTKHEGQSKRRTKIFFGFIPCELILVCPFGPKTTFHVLFPFNEN